MSAKLITGTGIRTRAEIGSHAVGLANRLKTRGVRPGDRVIVMAENSPDLVMTLLALMHLDASIVLIDAAQTESECHRVARLTGARWAFTSRAIPMDGVQPLSAESHESQEKLDFTAWERRRDGLITWSSGSTGAPKGVVRRGGAFLDDMDRTCARMGYQDSDVLLPLVPFSHFYGLTLIVIWWRIGCTLVISTGRLDQMLRLGGANGVTVVDGTPATYHSILRLAQRDVALKRDLSCVRMWCVGGAPLGESLRSQFVAAFGRPLLDGYGSNEAGNVALAASGSPIGCGRPLDGVSVSISDGEIVIQESPSLMEGYLAPDGTLEPVTLPFHTNDVGYFDESGNLFVTGRRLAVHRLGHTLYPAAIEQSAQACGTPVKVVALEDERLGSQLVFVVADPSGQDARHWRQAICAVLPAYEWPNQVIAVDQFPLTTSGKVDMQLLRRRGSRASSLDAVASFLESDPERVAGILCEISHHRTVEQEIKAALATLRGAVAEVQRYRPPALSHLAVIMPSNMLLYAYVLHVLVPALFTDSITIRSSSQVASQTTRLHELLASVHGLPVTLSTLDQQQFVAGPVAEAQAVIFTGAYANAERVRAGLRRDQLFVYFGGGVNPFVVGQDADAERAIEDAIRIRLHNSGQDCFAPDVFLIHRSMLERFTEGLCKHLSELRYGDDYGPLFYDSAVASATEYLHKNHRWIIHGGQFDYRTRQLVPTVLLRDPPQKLGIAEFFAPIFNIVPYDDDEWLRSTLTSPYFQERAMGAMLYGVPQDLVSEMAKRHAVAVNTTLLEIDDGNQPLGGRGVMANYVGLGPQRIAEPLLFSKAVADHWPSEVNT